MPHNSLIRTATALTGRQSWRLSNDGYWQTLKESCSNTAWCPPAEQLQVCLAIHSSALLPPPPRDMPAHLHSPSLQGKIFSQKFDSGKCTLASALPCPNKPSQYSISGLQLALCNCTPMVNQRCICKMVTLAKLPDCKILDSAVKLHGPLPIPESERSIGRHSWVRVRGGTVKGSNTQCHCLTTTITRFVTNHAKLQVSSATFCCPGVIKRTKKVGNFHSIPNHAQACLN